MSLKKNADVRKYLPHRESMLMVDKHLELTDTVVKTRFLIKKTNIFVDDLVFVESGLIENIAQTCSIIVGSSYFSDDEEGGENNSDVIGFISGIKNINIHKLPKVNDMLLSSAKLISRFDGDGFSICTMTGETHCNGELIFRLSIKFIY